MTISLLQIYPFFIGFSVIELIDVFLASRIKHYEYLFTMNQLRYRESVLANAVENLIIHTIMKKKLYASRKTMVLLMMETIDKNCSKPRFISDVLTK